METEGIKIDEKGLQEYSKQLAEDIRAVELEVYQMAGITFNMNSPSQLGEILFDRLKLDPKAKRTAKSKQYATGEEVLQALAVQHPIAAKILEHRGMQKLKSTYVDALPLIMNKQTGRIHTNYNQSVAATGRLSSTDPNLQNIPIKTERGREIRKAFIPKNDDYLILSADYSQIELRLIAEMSKEHFMIEAFKNGEDIHKATAAKVYGVPLEEVTKEMRNKAKMVNFGIIYGISAFGLSQRLGVSRAEAAELIASYNTSYPRIKAYMDEQIQFAKENGFVETIKGRRRYLRDINSANFTTRGFAERNAINAPIQGSAADLIKIAMINIYKKMTDLGLKSKMLLQVHDELVFDCYKPEQAQLTDLVKTEMQNAIQGLETPIEAETGIGQNWLEAH
jgi:DNA polymerase-1